MRRAIGLAVIVTIGFSCPVFSSDTPKGTGQGPTLKAPALSAAGTENLYLFGKVWGYLKYHHPRVTSGCLDWDAELLRVVVGIIDSHARNAAVVQIEDWVDEISDSDAGCQLDKPSGLHFSANDDWINDRELLGEALSESLQLTASLPRGGNSQFYVSQRAGVGNAQFYNEQAYRELDQPDWRYRLLALFRYWNIIEYWYPYRNIITADWDRVLKEFIPRFVEAEDSDQYVLELMALIARVEDSHANLWSSIGARPPAGEFSVPVHVRFVEGRPIVWRVLDADPSEESDTATADELQYGDVILAVDRVPVADLVEKVSPYYGVSNESTLLREIARSLLRGDEDEVVVSVERGGQITDVRIQRSPIDTSYRPTHDRDGDVLQLLSDDIAYLKLSTVDNKNALDYVETAKGHKGLIIDIRNYPSSFMVFALGQHLVTERTPFARVTNLDLSEPGTFRWTEPRALEPKEPHYSGRVVVLVDEYSQSQSEYTAMAFRAVPGAKIIGSQTAGADGSMSRIPLPGGHHTIISGNGVFYPDKSPTQKIGIIPDIEVLPTIDGIRAGRDEVLEIAVREIVGDDMSEDSLQEMTRIPHSPR
jgi:C-terminal processing protease CtpA/Prc